MTNDKNDDDLGTDALDADDSGEEETTADSADEAEAEASADGDSSPGDDDSGSSPGEADDESAADDAAAKAPVAENRVSETAPAPSAAEKSPDRKGDKKKGKDNKAKAEVRAAAVAPMGGTTEAGPVVTNEEAIQSIFSGTGQETPLGDPHASEYFDPDLDEPPRNLTSPKVLAFTAAGLGLVLAIAFFALPADLRGDALKIMQGVDIIEERQLREEARVAEERRAMLAAAPKFGTVDITTEPNNLLVTSPGQPQMIYSDSRVDTTLPTRTRITFQDISVTEDFTFTIHGEGNFEDKTYSIPAFGQPDSPWLQAFSGDYTASLVFAVCWPGEQPRVTEQFCIRPVAERAEELRWRRQWRPDANDTSPDAVVRLLGAITITSDPPGALIAFNGQQLIDEETGEPHRTPYSFNAYNAPRDREDRTPLEVYLSREGLPVQLYYDGKASTRFGVYAHQFLCTLKPNARPPAPLAPDADPTAGLPSWLNLCDYSYQVHVQLVDPKPPENGAEGAEAAEGSEAAAEGAEAAEGTEAAGEGEGAAPTDGEEATGDDESGEEAAE